ncbi:hypothetical protein CKAH01_13795 [Colletotrichum kahawae]|uniref:Uncharacterized protein n=1 Tax=Colletotrichum kahawae TaxID=34407 RepID=A0AAE0DAM0_COLKA|nr:hypothetical protein CKAH01_13795 [Colletotrichum kahawae]
MGASAVSDATRENPEKPPFRGAMVPIVAELRQLGHRRPDVASTARDLEHLARAIQNLHDEAERDNVGSKTNGPGPSSTGTK